MCNSCFLVWYLFTLTVVVFCGPLKKKKKKVSPFLRKVISLIKKMTFNWYFYLAFEIGLKSALKGMLWRMARY